MKIIARIFTVLLTCMVSLVYVPAAFAHPLGNFTINHYAGLHISQDSISIDYVLDMAEIPAFQEIAALDANGNAQADASEAASYHSSKCSSLQPDLRLRLNKQALNLTLDSSAVEFPAGAGGLPTLRLTCEFSASVANMGPMSSLAFVDNSYRERIGWREIVVTTEHVALSGDFASTSISKRLTSYPQDLLSSPLDQREIRLEIGGSSTPPQDRIADSIQPVTSIAASRSDAFTQLITLDNLTLPTVLFALLISFVWGAMHAMTPGHGKTIVGAYLVGSRGTMKHALYLGLTTTITHTLGVFAFGLITLFAARYIVPETLFPWITFASGVFVAAIGLNLFLQRFKSGGLGAWFGKWSLTRRPVQAALSAPSSASHIEPADHADGPRHLLMSVNKHIHDHHDHHVHGHHHHPHAGAHHSHTAPDAITWRSILAMGISGGLLPCPSALVVLLGAIALNRIGFGLILVFAFSLGLASALAAIGMMFIYAGKIFQRVPSSGTIINFLPAFSALFISLIGLGILYKAWLEIFL